MEKGLEGQVTKEINGKGTRRIANEGNEWNRDQKKR